jgi:hypothetical protein
VLAVDDGVAKVSTSAFKRAHPMLVPSLRSQPLQKAPARDSAPAARPVYRLPPQSYASMGATLSPPLTDDSYLDVGRFPTPMVHISMMAINATAPSTTLSTLYKHALLASNGAQTPRSRSSASQNTNPRTRSSQTPGCLTA